MKKALFFIALALVSLSVFSQQIFVKQALVVNVEVPVRVFKDGIFIDNLGIDDFQVFENGIPQKIEAIYLVKKRTVEKSEEKQRFAPETSRHFFLNFEVMGYTAELGRALEYFVQNIILPGDNLYVITPMKTYRLKQKALEVKTKENILNELQNLLRRDAMAGSSEYNGTVEELARLSRSISAAIQSGSLDSATKDATYPKEQDSFSTGLYSGLEFDEQLVHYEELLARLEILRQVDEMKLLEFARFLKNKEGQKYVFLFYQREFLPRIEPKILNQYISLYQERPDIVATISRVSEFQKREVAFNVDSVKQAYSDSSISIHFLFITKPAEIIPGIRMEEHTEDIFAPFKEMANATGGFAESSSNPFYLFQKALDASERYYLLYYSPKDYEPDNKFRNIQVKLKNKDYKVSHRAGYFAN
jgi:hypothetical protein